MADVIYPVTGRSINVRYADQNDGTHAEVVQITGGGGSSNVSINVADGADIALGSRDAAAASSDTGTFSIISLFKRLLQKLPTLGPQAASASLSVVAAPTDGIGNGTREYNFAAATRTAIGATSSAAVAIGTLGTSREVMLVASSRCMIKWGTSGVTAAAATDTDVLVLPADAMFHLRVPNGVTHFRVIRDTADGFLRVTPVA